MLTTRLVLDDVDGREAAIGVLRAGGIVALPTDTVYGVAVALDVPDGLARLFAAKERPLDKAIVLLVDSLEQAAEVGVFDETATALVGACWPGGLTAVVPQRPDSGLPEVLTGGVATVGLRLPDHPTPRRLARSLGPLPTTSANRSGWPDARDAIGVLEQLEGRIELVIDGGPARGGVPSSVVVCTGGPPRLVREGAIGRDRLEAILAEAGLPPEIDVAERPAR